MNLEIHQETPDQINQEEIQAHRVHQAVQADLHQIDRDQIVLNQIDHLLRVHQVVQADPHQKDRDQIDHLLRVHQVVQAGQADQVVQVVIEIEVSDPAEAGVHVLEKMNNVMTVVLN
jgi:hypothetical protein